MIGQVSRVHSLYGTVMSGPEAVVVDDIAEDSRGFSASRPSGVRDGKVGQ